MRNILQASEGNLATSTAIAICLSCAGPVLAQARTFDLPAQDARTGIPAFARQAGIQLIGNIRDLKGKRTNAVRGSFEVQDALKILLSGASLVVVSDASTGISIVRSAPVASPISGEADAGAEPATRENEIVVTGSRIPGAQSASPVFSHRTDAARDQGVTDMHAFAATIPQNFNGGQNPGVGNGGEGAGNESGDTSTGLNLRGLGPDSTLTLLNGHRMAYDANSQAVDFSAIPFAAVDRVEVMPDGASAIYGSDAVGGVANIILKRDYQGLTANAVLGAATEGGYFNQDYSLVGGQQWSTGGIVLTGDFSHNSAITARQRSFASAAANPNLTLYPADKFYGFVGTGHQQLTDRLSLDLDGLYSHRSGSRVIPYNLTGPTTDYGNLNSSSNWSLSVSPTLTLDLSPWKLSLNGVYAKAHTALLNNLYSNGAIYFRAPADYTNQTRSIELSGEGALFTLPGGEVKLALGAGYRRAQLDAANNLYRSSDGQKDGYGFAELGVPIVSPDQHIPAIETLSFDAAVRYEDYPGIARVTTPKLGLIYTPIAGIDVKGSWGKSFKAPTLVELDFPVYDYLYPGNLFGQRTAPANQTMLLIDGGNPNLKPERATSWSATLDIHPVAIPRLNIQVTYFDARYRDRIVSPISSLLSALGNPAYDSLINYSPSATDIGSALALAPGGLTDYTGLGIVTGNLYAIVDERYQNVASQKFHGIDATAAYSIVTQHAGTFNLQGDLTWLDSTEQLLPGSPSIPLTGVVFRPAHIRGRGGLTWLGKSTTFSGIVNYVSGVDDNRFTPVARLHAMTTFDLSIKRHIGKAGHGLDVQLSALNLFDAKPSIMRTNDVINQTYDFTNYSGIGRYVSISLTRAW